MACTSFPPGKSGLVDEGLAVSGLGITVQEGMALEEEASKEERVYEMTLSRMPG